MVIFEIMVSIIMVLCPYQLGTDIVLLLHSNNAKKLFSPSRLWQEVRFPSKFNAFRIFRKAITLEGNSYSWKIRKVFSCGDRFKLFPTSNKTCLVKKSFRAIEIMIKPVYYVSENFFYCKTKFATFKIKIQWKLSNRLY